jgi:O-antigen/teichoic acid export membrane protein
MSVPAEKPSIPELPRVARGAGLNFIGAVSRSLLGFAAVFVLARIMSATELGLFFLSLNILMFTAIIGIAGLDAGLRRFVSIAHGHDSAAEAWTYLRTALAMAAPLNLALVALLLAGAGVLGDAIFEKSDLTPLIRAFSPYLAFYAAAELLLAVTQGYKHMKYWVLCLDIFNNALRIILALFFAALGWTLYGAVSAYVLAILAASILAFYYFQKVMPRRPAGAGDYRFREMASFSLPVSLARLLNSGTGIVEIVILGYFAAAADVGVYTVALKIAAIGSIILASLNTVFAPLISQLYAQERLKELHELYKAVTRWVFSLSLPVFLVVAWYASPIAQLFGAEYAAGSTAIVILCAGQVVNAVTGPSGNLLLMSGHSLTNLWINLLGLALTIALSVILIPRYGVVGCAAAVASAMAIVNLVRLIFAGVFMRMHPYDRDYWKPLVAGGIALAILAQWGRAPDTGGGLLQLMISVGLGLLIYVAVLFGLGLNRGDRYVLNKVRQRFLRK